MKSLGVSVGLRNRCVVGIVTVLVVISSLTRGVSASHEALVTMDYAAPYYAPSSVIVPTGTSIHIFNPTSSPHTVTHDGCIDKNGFCAFDTGTIGPDEKFIMRPLAPGRYPYHCALHPLMKGEILVGPQQLKVSNP